MRLTQVLIVAGILGASPFAHATAEICGNDVDDDGNGLTDEGCYPTLATGVCESPLSCNLTGMVSWTTGSLHYDLPPDIAPAVPMGPGIGLRRFYTSAFAPGTAPASVNKNPLGPRWQHTYLTYVDSYTDGGGHKRVVHHTSQGRDVFYTYSTTVSGWDVYTPQTGDHVMTLKHNTVSPFQYQVQLLTGETLVYNSSGQLSEIWDTLPTPNKVLVTWDSTSNGNVSTVTDAHGRRRLLFSYTSGLLQSVQFQTKSSGGTWSTQHTSNYVYTSGNLTTVKIGGVVAQQYSYVSSYLTQITDGAGNQIAAFSYDATTASKVDRVSTSRGTVGLEFSSTRAGCTGDTILYFNQGNTTSCSVDTDCGSGFLCGGKTGTGATGKCFLAGRCMQTATVNGESVVTNISPLGPGGGSCTGACTDVAQYIWTGPSSGLINVTGREDPLGNYTSATYNPNGLPTQIGYGDGDGDPTNGGTNRTVYLFYDSTFPGRIAEVRRPSDLSSGSSSCSATNATGCARTIYSYYSDTHQLQSITQSGWTLDIRGGTAAFSNVITYHQDTSGRTTEIDGAVSGIKTTFDYLDGKTDPNLDAFLGDYKAYKDATNFLEPQIIAYDFWGHPTGLKAPDGNLTCDTYSTTRGYLTSRRHAMAGQTDCTTTNAADLTTSWTRDSYLRLSQLTRPDGSCVLYSYDTSGRMYQIKRRDDCNAASTGDTQQFSYTADSQVSEIDIYNASSTLTAKQPYAYFDSRRLQEIVNPVNTSKFTGLVYDSAGKLTEVDGASSLSKTVYHFDGAPGRDNRVSSEQRFRDSTNSDTWSLLYDWIGGQSQVTDGDSKATQSVRDDVDRLTKLVSPDTADPTLRVFDAASRITTIVEVFGGGANQQTHSFTFDFLNRPLNADYQGTCPTGTAHPEIQRTYDAMPTGITCPLTGGCNNIAGRLSYVKASLLCSSAYADDGSLDQETFYSYDPAGRIVEEYIRDDSGRVADHLYSWTKNGALAQVTTPSTAVIGWTFGSAGNNSDTDLVTGMFRTNTSTPILESVTWFPFGPLQGYTQENTSSTIKEQTLIARNVAYRITNMKVYTSGGTIQQIAITEDAKGRVIGRDYYPNSSGIQDSSYFYDEQDRVLCETASITASCPASGNKNSHSLSPPFLTAGDWKRDLRPIAGTSPVGYINDFNSSGTTYGTSHQVTDVNQSDGTPAFGHTAIGYDARGNRSYDDNTTTLTNDRRDYTYDARRNVINVRGQYYTGAAWHYYDVASAFDAKNRRVYKSFYDETTLKTAQWFFYYDALDRLTEIRYTPDTSAPTSYSLFQLFWLEDRMVLYWQTDYPSVTTSKRYVDTDEVNRPIDMICWGTGNCGHVWTINPSAWGFDTNLLGPTVFQPLLFAGKYADSETSAFENDGVTVHREALSVTSHRTYDPFVGGYLQVATATPTTWDSYVFAHSDPVGVSDETSTTEPDLGAPPSHYAQPSLPDLIAVPPSEGMDLVIAGPRPADNDESFLEWFSVGFYLPLGTHCSSIWTPPSDNAPDVSPTAPPSLFPPTVGNAPNAADFPSGPIILRSVASGLRCTSVVALLPETVFCTRANGSAVRLCSVQQSPYPDDPFIGYVFGPNELGTNVPGVHDAEELTIDSCTCYHGCCSCQDGVTTCGPINPNGPPA